MAAGVVDLAVVGVVGAVLSLAAGTEFTPLLGAVTVAWGLFYYFVTESIAGQTLGKRWLGLRVERAAGGTPDEREIALRTILRLVDGIGFYLVGLAVMLRTGERRQRLGDIVAGTAVVDARQPSKPSVKSTLKTIDFPITSPEVPAGAEAEVEEEQPHRAELPTSLFTHDRDEETPSPVEPDDGPRIEIVSQGDEDLTAEPELPVAEVEEPEPEAELPLPEPEEVDEPATDEQEKSMPRVSSEALDELAGDVASTTSKPGRKPRKQAEPEKAPADEEITVKPVETVSPIDLVMDDAQDEPEKAGKAPRPRARSRGGAS